MGGEDFSFMLQVKPGAYVFIGNGIYDVLLPSTIHAEKEGTFTNVQGRVHVSGSSIVTMSFASVMAPTGRVVNVPVRALVRTGTTGPAHASHGSCAIWSNFTLSIFGTVATGQSLSPKPAFGHFAPPTATTACCAMSRWSTAAPGPRRFRFA